MRFSLKKAVNAGADGNTDFSETTRLRGMNTGVLIGIAALTGSIFAGADSAPFVWHLIVMGIALVGSLILNFMSFTRLARHFLLIFLFSWITEASMGFGPKMGLEYFFFVLLVSNLIFEIKDSSRLILSGTVIVAFSFVKYYQQQHPAFYTLPANAPVFYFTNIILTCFLVTLLCWNMLHDVKRFQQTLIQNEQALKASNQQKDKIFSIISHDLRGPIGTLKSSMALLENQELTEEEHAMFIQGVREHLNITSGVMDSLLQWSSQSYFRSVTPAPKESVIDLQHLADHTIDLYKENAARKNVDLRNHIPPETLVLADNNQMMFVFRNLVGNAIKYSNADGSGYVALEMTPQEGMAAIHVSDNGTGIEPHVLTNLFDVEKRTSTEGTHQEKGTGLGLIFSKEFVEHNGGAISVTSKPGEGSKFTFTLKTPGVDQLS